MLGPLLSQLAVLLPVAAQVLDVDALHPDLFPPFAHRPLYPVRLIAIVNKVLIKQADIPQRLGTHHSTEPGEAPFDDVDLERVARARYSEEPSQPPLAAC